MKRSLIHWLGLTEYLVTCIMMAAVYYILHFLGNSGIMDGMPGGHTASDMMQVGTYIMALFGTIFLLYTQSTPMMMSQQLSK